MITLDQRNDMLSTLYHAYLSQQAAGVGPELQPGMDAVQKQIRALPLQGEPEPPPVQPPAEGVEIVEYAPNDPDGLSMLLTAAPGAAYAIAIRAPAGATSAYGGIASVPTGGIPLEAKVSAVAGDFAGAFLNGNPSFTLTPPAPLQYFNVRLPAGYVTPERLRYFANVR